MDILLLLFVGVVGGFIAGLVGVGGGIIFGPALFFWFQAQGIEDPILTPLTLGTSLLCTFLAALSGTVGQHYKDAIDWRTAAVASSFAALAATLLTLFVTTKAWYSKEEFRIVLGIVLVGVVVRMLSKTDGQGNSLSLEGARRGLGRLGLIGAAAGTIAAAAGIGGGIIMVPAFNGLVKLPLKLAAGTSTATITLLTAVSVIAYAIRGLGVETPAGSIGYVDLPHALVLGVPAMGAALLGVSVAHRINVRWVRYSFAAFVAVVAIRLIWSSLV